MKKLLTFLLLAFMVSCSSEDATVDSVNSQSVESTLQNGILTFKDEKSFIGEYSKLSKMNPSELQKWISAKKVNSLLNTSSDSLVMQDEILSDSRIIYSDAMKAILNNESKVKIGEKVLWLNGNDLFLLSGLDKEKSQQELKSSSVELKIYGKVLGGLPKNYNLDKMVSKGVPNANRSKDWVHGYSAGGRDRRVIFTLFNETVVLNGVISSSNMFIKCVKQGKYCSTWKCRWNNDNDPKDISVNQSNSVTNSIWYNLVYSQTFYGITGDFTLQLATLSINPGETDFPNYSPPVMQETIVRVKVDGVEKSQTLSWY